MKLWEVTLDTVSVSAHHIAEMMGMLHSDPPDWVEGFEPKHWPNTYEFWGNPDLRVVVRDERGKTHNITPDMIQLALQAMAEDSPTDFRDLLNNEADPYTADVFLQYVCYGGIAY